MRGLVELWELGIVKFYIPLEGCAGDTREVSEALCLSLFILWDTVLAKQRSRRLERVAKFYPFRLANTQPDLQPYSVTSPGAAPICSIASTPSDEDKKRLDMSVYLDSRIFHSPFTRAYTSS